MARELIKVEELVKVFRSSGLFASLGRKVAGSNGAVRAVDRVSFSIAEGETLGLVGESGCGKTTLARTLLRLTPAASGRVLFDGTDMMALGGRDLRRLRKKVRMIFQNPDSALNPNMRIGATLEEALAHQTDLRRSLRRAKVPGLLQMVNLPSYFADYYPYQLSGGQKRRVTIARALAGQPRFIVGDEPVSALDVSIQAQIINLLKSLQEQRNLSFLFISHDIGMVKYMSHRIAIMFGGRIVEIGRNEQISQSKAKHPYTRVLFSSVLFDAASEKTVAPEDWELPADVPERAPACVLWSRCPLRRHLGSPAECLDVEPQLEEVEPEHRAACHFTDRIGELKT